MRWNYNSTRVTTIKYHFFKLFAPLQHIINDENNEREANSIALVNSIRRVLSDPKFMYLTHFYDKIFFSTDILYDIFVTQCITEVQNCKTYLSNRRNENFVNVCVGRASKFLNRIHIGENEDADVDIEMDGIVEYYSLAKVSKLRRISFEILDSIIPAVHASKIITQKHA